MQSKQVHVVVAAIASSGLACGGEGGADGVVVRYLEAGEPVAGARVVFSDVAGAMLATAMTDEEGDWRAAVVTTRQWDSEFRRLKVGVGQGAAIPAAIRGASERNCRELRQLVQSCGYVRKISDNQWVAV